MIDHKNNNWFWRDYDKMRENHKKNSWYLMHSEQNS
jgi:hypothetical protein